MFARRQEKHKRNQKDSTSNHSNPSKSHKHAYVAVYIHMLKYKNNVITQYIYIYICHICILLFQYRNQEFSISDILKDLFIYKYISTYYIHYEYNVIHIYKLHRIHPMDGKRGKRTQSKAKSAAGLAGKPSFSLWSASCVELKLFESLCNRWQDIHVFCKQQGQLANKKIYIIKGSLEVLTSDYTESCR